MNYITPEQFEKHFTVNGKTLAVTPSASLCARSLGHSVYFHRPNQFLTNKRDYDTVLLDIPEGLKYPEYKSRHEFAWLKLALSFVRQDGIVNIRASTKIIPQLRQFNNLYAISVIFEDGYVYLKCKISIQESSATIQYPTGEKVSLNTNKSILPYYYNQKHLDYINLVEENDTKIEYDDSVCVGGKQRDMFEKIYKKSLKEKTYGLLIQNNTKKLQISKLEDQSCNSSADVYLFSSEKQRDRYFDKLNTCDIIKLADNLACGGEINKKVQSYLMSPFIFDYAI